MGGHPGPNTKGAHTLQKCAVLKATRLHRVVLLKTPKRDGVMYDDRRTPVSKPAQGQTRNRSIQSIWLAWAWPRAILIAQPHKQDNMFRKSRPNAGLACLSLEVKLISSWCEFHGSVPPDALGPPETSSGTSALGKKRRQRTHAASRIIFPHRIGTACCELLLAPAFLQGTRSELSCRAGASVAALALHRAGETRSARMRLRRRTLWLPLRSHRPRGDGSRPRYVAVGSGGVWARHVLPNMYAPRIVKE